MRGFDIAGREDPMHLDRITVSDTFAAAFAFLMAVAGLWGVPFADIALMFALAGQLQVSTGSMLCISVKVDIAKLHLAGRRGLGECDGISACSLRDVAWRLWSCCRTYGFVARRGCL